MTDFRCTKKDVQYCDERSERQRVKAKRTNDVGLNIERKSEEKGAMCSSHV